MSKKHLKVALLLSLSVLMLVLVTAAPRYSPILWQVAAIVFGATTFGLAIAIILEE